jgi:hypothetical protein
MSPRSALIPAFLLASLSFAFSGGTVTNLTQADLETALQGGGTVQFYARGTLALTNTIAITQNTTLDANTNSHQIIISGGSLVRLFQVTSNVQLWVKGLTLSDGSVTGANGANGDPPEQGGDAYGAGILNQGGRVILTDCTLTNNAVQGGNAGTDDSSNPVGLGARGGNAMGGAIFSIYGELDITNCVVVTSRANGGLGSGALNWPIMGDGGAASGGAIYSDGGTVNLQKVTFTSNNAKGAQAMVYPPALAGLGGSGEGGAAYLTNSTANLISLVFSANSAVGGPSPANVLNGTGGGNGLGGAVFLASGSSLLVRTSSFDSNRAAGGLGARNGYGGVAQGGALFNGGELQLFDTSISSNQVLGGSLQLYPGEGQGGGVYSTKLLVVNACSFFGNVAAGGDANMTSLQSPQGASGEGGGLWTSMTLEATNCTFTANTALAGNAPFGLGGVADGGAIRVAGGAATLVNLTLSANRADGTNQMSTAQGPSNGGGLSATNGNVTVRNSIIANSAKGGDVWGVIIDGGYNICSDGTAGFSNEGSLSQVDPMLSALTQNGGPTPTMSLLAGSPARDAIPSGFPPTDQRGISRPQGTAADIGAFEADVVSSTPAILTQPLGGTVRAGTNMTFTVRASGTAPLTYQWSKDGTALTGATESSFSLSNVQAADAGTYFAVVTNAYGSATSQGAVLVVDSRPVLLTQPTSVVISPGATAGFSVSVDGPALTYQWSHDSTTLSGAVSSALVVSNAMAGAQGNYFVMVTNFAGSVTSAPATLTFDSSALSILVPPKDQIVEAGYPASFSVLVSGIPPFAYQWQHNGTALLGATSSTLTLLGVSTNDAGSYNVVVTNGYSSVVSAGAQLTVTPGAVPPALVVQRFGQNITITFNAQGGRTYRLLGSTNLISWDSRATNSVVSSGPLQFVQPIRPIPGDFFRVVTP